MLYWVNKINDMAKFLTFSIILCQNRRQRLRACFCGLAPAGLSIMSESAEEFSVLPRGAFAVLPIF